MERLPEWAKAVCSVIALLLLPSIGFVYTQGEDAKANEHLAKTNTQLTESVKQLTTEINALSTKITAESIRVDYSERRLDKVEEAVTEHSQVIATMKGGNNG